MAAMDHDFQEAFVTVAGSHLRLRYAFLIMTNKISVFFAVFSTKEVQGDSVYVQHDIHKGDLNVYILQEIYLKI